MKMVAAGLAALLLALSVTACTQPARGETNPSPVSPPGGARGPEGPGAYQVHAIIHDAAPQTLKDWAATQQDQTESAHQLHEQDGVTYVAVTAGLQSSGGWIGGVRRTGVAKNGTRDVLELDVAFTPPDGPATMALTNPVAFVRIVPALEGEIRVAVEVPKAPSEVRPLTFSVIQGDGMGDYLSFYATGDLSEPRVELHLNGKVLGSTELKAQFTGEWTWSLERPKEHTEQIEIHLFSGGEVVGVVPMRYGTLPGQQWTDHLLIDAPAQIGAKEVVLKGEAWALEGALVAEVRYGGELVVRQPLQAHAGATDYERFEYLVLADQEIPLGSEVWLITESAQDGSERVELIAPLYRIG